MQISQAETSSESNACSVFVSCPTHFRMSPHLCDQLDAKDEDIEKALISCDVTTKAQMK